MTPHPPSDVWVRLHVQLAAQRRRVGDWAGLVGGIALVLLMVALGIRS